MIFVNVNGVDKEKIREVKKYMKVGVINTQAFLSGSRTPIGVFTLEGGKIKIEMTDDAPGAKSFMKKILNRALLIKLEPREFVTSTRNPERWLKRLMMDSGQVLTFYEIPDEEGNSNGGEDIIEADEIDF